MEKPRIQWHPGFVSAMELEFSANRGDLEYRREHSLNRKPLEIDLLVIKKNPDAQIANEIGRLFRGHNIMEYKSPGYRLDIDTFYKSQAYAALYKAYGKGTDKVKAEDVTLTLVRENRPAGLFRYFRKHHVRLERTAPGIYRVLDRILFRTQIIVTGELEGDGHAWLKALSANLRKQEMLELMKRADALTNESDKRLADSVLEVSIGANRKVVEELRKENDMYKALMEIMKPEIDKLLSDNTKSVTESVTKSVTESVTENVRKTENEKSVLNSVKSFHELNIGNGKIEELLVRNYGLTTEEARGYL